MFFNFRRRNAFKKTMEFLNESLKDRAEEDLMRIFKQIELPGLIIGFSKHKFENTFHSIASLNDDLFKQIQIVNNPTVSYVYGKYVDKYNQVCQPKLVTYKGVFVRIESEIFIDFTKYRWLPEEVIRKNVKDPSSDVVWNRLSVDLKRISNYSDVHEISLGGNQYTYLVQLEDDRHIILGANNQLYEVSNDYREVKLTSMSIDEIENSRI